MCWFLTGRDFLRTVDVLLQKYMLFCFYTIDSLCKANFAFELVAIVVVVNYLQLALV